jgi:hypothetical protein
MVYHVLNRANGRQTIFLQEADYAAFERVLAEAVQRVDMRLLAYWGERKGVRHLFIDVRCARW